MENWPETLGYRFDFYTAFIFLGAAQAIFLTLFFWLAPPNNNWTYRFLGAILLALGAIMLEIFLCYSGLIVHVPHLVDFSEPFNFLVPPAIYLMVLTFVGKRPRNWFWHFLPFVLYSLYHTQFFLQNEVFKLNAFRDAYHDYLPELPNKQYFSADPWCIKVYVNELSVLQALLYTYPIFLLIQAVFNQEIRSWKNINNPAYRWIFTYLLLKFGLILLWLLKVVLEVGDSWDNVGASLEAMTIYVLNFFILKDGVLHRKGLSEKKYQKSTLSETQMDGILQRLTREMENQQPYLNPKLTPKILAEKLKISPHHLSQVLNEQLQKTYYEWIAEYRVAAAKHLLLSEDKAHLKLGAIGRMAGFNSRSVFYKAFKKLEGCSPSAFRNKAESN
ncbi:MAG: helix-turn-helix domain-containing protein [Bacteroidota bacterium]